MKYIEGITRAIAWLENSLYSMARLLAAISDLYPFCTKWEIIKKQSLISDGNNKAKLAAVTQTALPQAIKKI